RELQSVIDLVEKDDDSSSRGDQQDFAKEPRQTLIRGAFTGVGPPGSGVNIDASLPSSLAQQPDIPVVGGLSRPDAGNADQRDQASPFGQFEAGARHEARLADLTRAQNIAVFPFEEEIEQLSIFRSLDVEMMRRIECAARLQLARGAGRHQPRTAEKKRRYNSL